MRSCKAGWWLAVRLAVLFLVLDPPSCCAGKPSITDATVHFLSLSKGNKIATLVLILGKLSIVLSGQEQETLHLRCIEVENDDYGPVTVFDRESKLFRLPLRGLMNNSDVSLFAALTPVQGRHEDVQHAVDRIHAALGVDPTTNEVALQKAGRRVWGPIKNAVRDALGEPIAQLVPVEKLPLCDLRSETNSSSTPTLSTLMSDVLGATPQIGTGQICADTTELEQMISDLCEQFVVHQTWDQGAGSDTKTSPTQQIKRKDATRTNNTTTTTPSVPQDSKSASEKSSWLSKLSNSIATIQSTRPSSIAQVYMSGAHHHEDLVSRAEHKLHRDIAQAVHASATNEHALAALRPYLVHEIASSTQFLFIIFCIIAIFCIIVPKFICPAIVDVVVEIVKPLIQFVVIPALVEATNKALNPKVTQAIATIMLLIMNIILVMKLSMTVTMALADAITADVVEQVVAAAVRNVIAFMNLSVNGRMVNEIIHEVTWTVSANVIHRVQHSVVHGLTHSVTHTVTHKVIHHWYCIYCYYYGNYCDYCYYYEDYTYLHSLWGFGLPMPHTAPPKSPEEAKVQHQLDIGPLAGAIMGMANQFASQAAAAVDTVKDMAQSAKDSQDGKDKDKDQADGKDKDAPDGNGAPNGTNSPDGTDAAAKKDTPTNTSEQTNQTQPKTDPKSKAPTP